ncbi:MAG: FRG domain-containing protein [Eubacterium sp.]|nr:FRG domain-containing protein [Eubacterium sp.]
MMAKSKFEKRLENELDFDFRLDKERIESVGEFEEKILEPFNQNKRIFFRGERREDITRPLLPSIYRNREFLFDNGKRVNLINADFLYSCYSKTGDFLNLFEKIIGRVHTDKMYPFLAFSQHYFGLSPLIDFSKSPYSALSFALKDRKEYDEDILFYTLEIKNDSDYTNSIDKANEWIKNYSVLVFRDVTRLELESPIEALVDYKTIIEMSKKKSNLFEMNTPSAKLIDVPTNDLMLYQQGVFLLLDDFSLMGKSYLTKKIRNEFNIRKWIISKDICPELLDMLIDFNPYYSYKYITNLNLIANDIKKKL